MSEDVVLRQTGPGDVYEIEPRMRRGDGRSIRESGGKGRLEMGVGGITAIGKDGGEREMSVFGIKERDAGRGMKMEVLQEGAGTEEGIDHQHISRVGVRGWMARGF